MMAVWDAASEVLGIGQLGATAPMALVSAVEQGLPLTALDRLVRLVAPGDIVFTHRLVARATLARRRKAALGARQHTAARLSKEEGARVARVAEIWAAARDVWGTDDEARRFLFTPHPLLDDHKPMDVVLANEHGRPAVEGILGRLKYGSAV